MPRFMPPANRPLGPMGYHQVPADIIEDAEALVAWARKAVAVALRRTRQSPSRAPREEPGKVAKAAASREEQTRAGKKPAASR